MYLMNLSAGIDGRFDKLINDPGQARAVISILKSSYRKQEVADIWSPLDIALFIAGITRFGRDWESVKSILPNKSAPELSQFYYTIWKGTRMHIAWRKLRKQRGLE
jgi:hypothetical protein